jgi:hypothetical protein
MVMEGGIHFDTGTSGTDGRVTGSTCGGEEGRVLT